MPEQLMPLYRPIRYNHGLYEGEVMQLGDKVRISWPGFGLTPEGYVLYIACVEGNEHRIRLHDRPEVKVHLTPGTVVEKVV